MSLLMPGYAEQAGLLVQNRLDLLGAEPEVLKEVKDHPRVEGTRPRPHAEAVERGEPERAVDALPILQRAETGATTQVRDDSAPVGDLGRHLWQDRGDVLVRQAVESVALHDARADVARQRHDLGDGGLPPVEAGVEASYLRHAGKLLGDRVDRRQVVRLMERSERNQRSQLLQNRRGEDGGTCKAGTPMDNAMTDAEHARTAVLGAKPGGQGIEGGATIAHVFLVELEVGEAPA